MKSRSLQMETGNLKIFIEKVGMGWATALIRTSFQARERRFCFHPWSFCFHPWSFPRTQPLTYASAWRLDLPQFEGIPRYRPRSLTCSIPIIPANSEPKSQGIFAPKKMLDFCKLILWNLWLSPIYRTKLQNGLIIDWEPHAHQPFWTSQHNKAPRTKPATKM